ncbi:hypothetical protein KGM_214789 [Danaus plexippus plexippus]|uniref:ELYS-like domain-containing protein n=1 Tax=Danaus plexippus plexippus TaxID=278856 RepID=A0A212EI54_DANPL|nr:hypothetical protein KGM_214789 [Danaus plexippus plexippus]
MSTARCPEISRGSCVTLDLRLDSESVTPYSHATRLEEHFFPNSLQYNCVALSTWSTAVVQTAGVQRQLVRGMSAAGPACLLAPARLYAACKTAGLTPLYAPSGDTPEDQRRFLLSVALEARLSSFLKRCAHDWATGTHSGVGCTLPFLVDWSWSRAIELKENAKELTAPLFTSSMMPDRNVIRCLEHCVQQLSQLTGLLDAILTKCCNLVVPDALSEMEEKYKGIGTVSLYFQVVQWFVRVGLLPEKSSDRHSHTLPYPVHQLCGIYNKRRIKLNRLQDKSDDESSNESCSLLYIDQLIEHEFGGDRVHQLWMVCGSSGGLYPPPSLFSLLRLYLLPDVPEEHKHSLLLYLLLDYSMIYDDMRHESVIRRLMQFPTMFGLSNTAIKATQAFWHLDHRDFDFALDQLQCLTGNTLSDWQHHVVLSSLLAQKKTQSALQYLHVRKPAPIHVSDNNDYDKLDDWQTSCNLYLARGLVFEALDVIRMCVENAGSSDDKTQLLNYFYKGCRNSGQLAKVLQVTLLPFEEEVFIRYLKECNESHTSDILVMYYLQQARYLEAEQYNSKLKTRHEQSDRGSARDALVATLCRDLPDVTGDVLRCAMNEAEPRNSTLMCSERLPEVPENKDKFVYICSTAVALSVYKNTTHPLESPPKKFAAEDISPRKSYKDNVRARRSLSISANSSLSEDPNTSIESIADIPVTLINPRYTGERYMRDTEEERDRDTRNKIHVETEKRDTSYVPNTPKGRRAIRSDGDNTPLSGSRSNTPDRCDSPIITPKRVTRSTRSRSRTPEISPKSSLTPIEELPRQETDTASYKSKYIPSPREHFNILILLHRRSRTPERIEKVIEPPRLEAISESPTKSSQPPQSPTRRSLRSRSRTPEVEIKVDPPVITSPRSLRSRSKTPEKLMSPKKDHGTRKKSLSRIVLEANAFAKTKQIEKMDEEDKPDATGVIECTPVKPSKHTEPPHPCLMDVEFSPIVNKSILHSSSESFSITEKISKSSEDQIEINQLPAFTINEIYTDKSVLHSYQSSIGGTESIHDTRESIKETVEICKPLPAFTSITDDFGKSVLHSFESTIDSSNIERKETPKSKTTDYGVLSTDTSASVGQQNESLMTSDSEIDDREWSRLDNQNARVIQKEKERIVEIEREINEIEEMSDECRETCSDSNDSAESEEEEEGSESENDNEVISIEDSDESSDTYKLEIEEDNVIERNQQEQLVQATVGTARDDVAEPQASGSGIQENNEADSELFQASQEKPDALNPARDISILTDDNSVTETEGADKLHYSDEIKNDDQSVAMETDQPVIASVTVEQITTIEQNIEQEIPSREVDVIDSGPSRREDHKVEESETVKTTEAQMESQAKCVPDIKDKDIPEEIENSVVAQEESDKVEIKTQTEDIERTEDTEQVPKTRKRTKSTTSTRSKEGSEVNEKVEPRTPRRRRQSASKAEVEGTPDNNEHTPRTRAKTPSSEVRKILTRRASKELEKTDEHRQEEVPELTPRRSTRRTKKEDDNASVTSDSSVKSGRSRASEDGKPARKGRKSVMNVKPDLTVIPEVAAEESKASDDIIKEYSSARRLTRNQKAVLDSWLEPELPRRKNDNDSDSSLTRTDYDGSPEPDQDSDLETAVKPQRLARAASETKTTPKAARIGRRVSVDIEFETIQLYVNFENGFRMPKYKFVCGDILGVTPDEGSPVSGLSRGRRASFTRACEALHTPRRGSTDVKGSPMSEVESTPRRGRRPSATSVKGDVNTPRSKKAAEKNKETNE